MHPDNLTMMLSILVLVIAAVAVGVAAVVAVRAAGKERADKAKSGQVELREHLGNLAAVSEGPHDDEGVRVARLIRTFEERADRTGLSIHLNEVVATLNGAREGPLRLPFPVQADNLDETSEVPATPPRG